MSVRGLISSYLMCAKSRPIPLFAFTWPAFMSLLIASRSVPPLLEALKLVLAVTFVSYSVYFYNDIRDYEDDLRNKELGNPVPASRPLGSGKISMSRMWKFTAFSAILGLFFAYTINFQVLVLQLIYFVMGILYSSEPIRIKRRFLGKTSTIVVGEVIATLSGSLTLGVLNSQVIYTLLLNASYAGLLSPIWDIRDMKGDRISRVKTIPVLWGPELTIRLALGILIASEVATLIGYSRMGFTFAMPILFSIIVGTMIYVIFPLLNEWNDPVKLNAVLFKKVFPLFNLLQIPIYIGALAL